MASGFRDKTFKSGQSATDIESGRGMNARKIVIKHLGVFPRSATDSPYDLWKFLHHLGPPSVV